MGLYFFLRPVKIPESIAGVQMVIDELEQALHGILTPGIQTGQRCHAEAAVTDPFRFEYLKGLLDDRFHHAAGGVFSVSRHIAM